MKLIGLQRTQGPWLGLRGKEGKEGVGQGDEVGLMEGGVGLGGRLPVH